MILVARSSPITACPHVRRVLGSIRTRYDVRRHSGNFVDFLGRMETVGHRYVVTGKLVSHAGVPLLIN